MAILSLLFAILFIVGGSIRVIIGYVYFPTAAFFLLAFALTKTKFYKVAPFIFVVDLLAFSVVVTTLSAIGFHTSSDFFVGIFEGPWNTSVFLATLLFFRAPRLSFPMLIGELIVIVTQQALIVAFFGSPQVCICLLCAGCLLAVTVGQCTESNSGRVYAVHMHGLSRLL